MPLVLQAGIKRIYYINDYNNDSFCYDLAKSAGCELIKIDSCLDEIIDLLESGDN
jgi:hypothetical protein